VNITQAARDAGLTMIGYIACTYPTISAEQADEAGRQLFEALDRVDAVVWVLARHHAAGVVVGFVLGALLVLQAVVVGGGGHP